MTLTLPYPPSVNTYWRSVAMGRSVRVLISREGRTYRTQVAHSVAQARSVGNCGHAPLAGRLMVTVRVYPPDRRRRDIDNICKALLDSMGAAGVYLDDSQIDDLRLIRFEPCKPGRVEVLITEYCAGLAA